VSGGRERASTYEVTYRDEKGRGTYEKKNREGCCWISFLVCSSLRCDVNDSRPGMTCPRASSCQLNCKNPASCNNKQILIVEYLARNNIHYLASRPVLQMWCAFQRVCSLPGPASPPPLGTKTVLLVFSDTLPAGFISRAPAQVACTNPQPFARLPTPASHCPTSCNMRANDSLRWGGGREEEICYTPRKSCQRPMPSFEMPLLQQTAVSGWVFRSPHSPLLAVRRVVGTVAG